MLSQGKSQLADFGLMNFGWLCVWPCVKYLPRLTSFLARHRAHKLRIILRPRGCKNEAAVERQPHHLQPKCVCCFESSVSVWLNLFFVIGFVRIIELLMPSRKKIESVSSRTRIFREELKSYECKAWFGKTGLSILLMK